MKKIILILLFSAYGLMAFCQRKRKIRIKSPALQEYVRQNPSLNVLSFDYSPYELLQLQPDTVLFKLAYGQPYNNAYFISYADHRYLFEKQFGPFPQKIFNQTIDSFTRKTRPCQYYWYTGKIYRDSVVIIIHEACPEKGDEAIFIKVRSNFDYKGGPEALTEYLRRSIPADMIPVTDHDSILYYQLVVKRDSLAHDVTQPAARHTDLEDMIKEALLASKPWIPYEHGGIMLNIYVRVFIVFNKGRIIMAGYSRP
jgi:hypothetical protein